MTTTSPRINPRLGAAALRAPAASWEDSRPRAILKLQPRNSLDYRVHYRFQPNVPKFCKYKCICPYQMSFVIQYLLLQWCVFVLKEAQSSAFVAYSALYACASSKRVTSERIAHTVNRTACALVIFQHFLSA